MLKKTMAIASLSILIGATLGHAQDKTPPFGTPDDAAHAKSIWEAMQAEKLARPRHDPWHTLWGHRSARHDAGDLLHPRNDR